MIDKPIRVAYLYGDCTGADTHPARRTRVPRRDLGCTSPPLIRQSRRATGTSGEVLDGTDCFEWDAFGYNTHADVIWAIHPEYNRE